MSHSKHILCVKYIVTHCECELDIVIMGPQSCEAACTCEKSKFLLSRALHYLAWCHTHYDRFRSNQYATDFQKKFCTKHNSITAIGFQRIVDSMNLQPWIQYCTWVPISNTVVPLRTMIQCDAIFVSVQNSDIQLATAQPKVNFCELNAYQILRCNRTFIGLIIIR